MRLQECRTDISLIGKNIKHSIWGYPMKRLILLLATLAMSVMMLNQASASLVAYWTEDGNSNDVIAGHNPAATNAISFVPGKVSQAVTLGGGGYIDIPDSPLLQNQQFTVSAWVRPDGPGPNNDQFGSTFFQKGLLPPQGYAGSSISFLWSVSDYRFRFYIGGTTTNTIVSTNTFPPGSFYHVTGTYDGTTLKLYVNGALEGQLTESITIQYDSAVPWTIGSTSSYIRSVGVPRTWNGVIDEVKLFNRALNANEISVAAQIDVDADGIIDTLDNCPNAANPDQSDIDADLIGDACDPDIDGDGVLNGNDNCSLDPNPDQTDTDNDAVGNACDPDDDNDGVPDTTDNCALLSNSNQLDTDNDGIGNVCDTDDDNDGVLDAQDNCQLDPNPSQNDLDNDGIGDACENDTDGDGVDNNTDNCLVTPNADQLNTDSDANGNACDTDDDDDGIPDTSDNCSLIPNTAQLDSDADGLGDVCDVDDDNDTVTDQNDNCPLNSNFDQTDNDVDGLGNVCDADDDNDNVFDSNDNCPFTYNPNQDDADGDSQGDVCDGDIDGDGVLNANDNCSLSPNSDQADLDHDGLGNVCDADIDGDGVPNGNDNCPTTLSMPKVVVGYCNSGVTNLLLASGCTITDKIDECALSVTNHGDFVNCVAHLLNNLKNGGTITGQQKGAIQNCAAQANIP
jgi:hypothetical protein